MAAFFLLIGILAWQAGRHAPKPPTAALIIFSACSLCAILSKETAVMLPVLLFIWQIGEHGWPHHWSVPVRAGAPWFFAWVFSLAVALSLRLGIAGIGFPASVGVDFSLLAKTWVAYARLMVLPWPLNHYYTGRNIPAGPIDLVVALVLPLAVAGTFLLRRGREGLLSLLWIVIFLLPVASPWRPEGAMIATRFMYLPSIGFALLCASYVDSVPPHSRRRQALALVALIAVAAMALGVSRASRIWSSKESLLTRLHHDAPLVPMFGYDLANQYRVAGRYAEAAELYRRMLDLDPYLLDAHLNLGVTLMALGDYQGAEKAFQRLRQLSPNDHRVYGNLGNLRTRLGLWAESEVFFRIATELAPQDPLVHLNLGLSLEKLGRSAEAIVQYRRALELQPDLASARTHLTGLLQTAGGVPPR